MKILLINTNPVVSRLVSLCVRDGSVIFQEVKDIEEIDEDAYDIIFVDDASYDEKTTLLSGLTGKNGRVVFLSGRDSGEEIGGRFDLVIKKPFLPSQIQAVIDQIQDHLSTDESVEDEEISLIEPEITEEVISVEDTEHIEEAEERITHNHFIFPLAGTDESEDPDIKKEDEVAEEEEEIPSPKVLDGNEIEQIKALLEEENGEDEEIVLIDPSDEEEYEARKVEVITQKLEKDGLEILGEEEIISELSRKRKKKKSKSKKSSGKNTSSKKKRAKEEEHYTMEEALLAAIENMKPKKIKKLLKGAEVTIKIRFKDDV